MHSKYRVIRFSFKILLVLAIGFTYLAIISNFPLQTVEINQKVVALPLPSLDYSPSELRVIERRDPALFPPLDRALERQRQELIAQRRQTQIDKVERYFAEYGSSLSGYASIIVDQAERCGGDYATLVGIAGSESGLGRINYKKYNPYGYLNGVQYSSQAEALEFLSCRISEQHLAPCAGGEDLNCLARRYAGPQDDLDLFISKVRFFRNQVL